MDTRDCGLLGGTKAPPRAWSTLSGSTIFCVLFGGPAKARGQMQNRAFSVGAGSRVA